MRRAISGSRLGEGRVECGHGAFVPERVPPRDAGVLDQGPPHAPAPPGRFRCLGAADRDEAAAPTTADDGSVPHRLRSGVVVGFALAEGSAARRRLPQQLERHRQPRYHTASGWMPGLGGTVLVMGALADYINFGFWYAHAAFGDSGRRASQDGVGLRVEAFPFVAPLARMGGARRVLRVRLRHGQARYARSAAGAAAPSRSSASGVLYEWSVAPLSSAATSAIGPSLEYDAVVHGPFEQHGLIANLRLVFYGGP